MTSEWWQRVEEVFENARTRPPQERAAFLDQSCAGDDALRTEVEGLLAADARPDVAFDRVISKMASDWANDGTPSLVSQQIGRYRILEPLGSGGMGEVYLAFDATLERKVALKTLPTRFTQDPDRLRRFEQEARAASALNHPNIITIHEIGESGGTRFIATEYVDGETLHATAGEPPRPLAQVIEIGIQAAGALAAAHEAGIIHRDIKPANIMRRADGYIKVLDFGLAKLVGPGANLDATEAGRVMGTVNYMSPEQALGKPVDHRTDIFSLGVVLYEMATGRRLFEGQSEAAVYDAILHQEMPPLPDKLPTGSREFEQVIRRALAKEPAERYQSATELRTDLQRLAQGSGQTEAAKAESTVRRAAWRQRILAAAALLIALLALAALVYRSDLWREKNPAIAPVALPKKSVAVLPFANLSTDKGDEYLSDGITEELITVLAKAKGLRVPGRNSCFAFKGRNEEDLLRKVGQQLQVSAVLEGSVQRTGERLRVTARLINVADGYQLWTETYDREMKDILAVQGDMVQRVVAALKIQLGVDEIRSLTRKATENPEAYRLYLLGRHHLYQFTQTDATAAVDYFKQTLQLDPNFAAAYCGLADTYVMKGGNVISSREAWAKQKLFAQKAAAIDPNLSEARVSLARALMSTFDWDGARHAVSRAIELDPNSAAADDASARFLISFGRFDEAIEKATKALELDPLNPFMNSGLSWYLYWGRRYDEAIAQARSTLDLFPEDAFAHFVLGWCLIEKGNSADAVVELQKAAELDQQPWYVGWLGYAHAAAGNHAQAEQVIHRLDELAKERPVNPGARVAVYLGLGDKEKTLDWLEKCYEEQDLACGRLKIDQRFDGLRKEPRFQALLKKIGFDQ